MDDFDDDLVSTKSVSDEDLFNATKERKASSSSGSSCGGGKKLPPSRKISEFSSGDEQESVELPSISAATDRNRNTSTSSPIEIKGSPTRENLSSRASSDSKGSPRSSSSVESAGNTNSRLSIFRVLTRRSSNQSKHKSKSFYLILWHFNFPSSSWLVLAAGIFRITRKKLCRWNLVYPCVHTCEVHIFVNLEDALL